MPERAFFQSVIASLSLGDTPYLILLAHDAYDVPHRGGDDDCRPTHPIRSSPTFSVPSALSRKKSQNWPTPLGTRSSAPGDQPDCLPPELGFLFPTSTSAQPTYTMPCSIPNMRKKFIRTSSTRFFTQGLSCPRPSAGNLPARSHGFPQ